jgi:hypothetical protein
MNQTKRKRKAINDVLLASEEVKNEEVIRGDSDKILDSFINK